MNVNLDAADGCPIEAPDGLSLLFASTRADAVPGDVGNDIWVSGRLTSAWQTPKSLGEPVNSIANDFRLTPAYGRSLFFVSERPDNGTDTLPCGGAEIYFRDRARRVGGAHL